MKRISILRPWHFLARLGLLPYQPPFSVVTAAYNAAPYLEEYFTSLTSQSLNFARHIRVIFVDDGSTDDTQQVVTSWEARYPGNISYVRQSHSGQAIATNAGIKLVSTPWVSLLDADDFLDRDYFSQVLHLIRAHRQRPLMAISTNTIFFREDRQQLEDTHPLNYRFKGRQSTIKSVSDLGEYIQISASVMVFDAKLLADSKSRFDPHIRPNFLDGHFVNLLMLEHPSTEIAFLPEAKYFYRKRASGTSTIDTSWENKGRYFAVLKFGYLDLLKAYKHRLRKVPLHIQRTVLYDLMFHFRRFASGNHGPEVLSSLEKEQYFDLLFEIFSYIDVATIMNFALNRCKFQHRLGILSLFKLASPPFQKVYFDSLDPSSNTLSLHYYTTPGDQPSFTLDNEELRVAGRESSEIRFVGRLFYTRHDAVFPLGGAEEMATFRAQWTKTPAVKYRLPSLQRKRPFTSGELKHLLIASADKALSG